MTFKTHEDEFSSRISSRSTSFLSTYPIEYHGHELLETSENNDHLDLTNNSCCTTRQIQILPHNVYCFYHYFYLYLKTPYHCDIQGSHQRHLKWMTKLPNTSLKTRILWVASAWKIFRLFHIVVRRNFRGTQRSYGKRKEKKVYLFYPVQWVTRDHKQSSKLSNLANLVYADVS